MVDIGTGGHAGRSRIDLDHPISFMTLTGDSLKASVKRITLSATEQTTLCMLTLEVDWRVYQEMLMGEWMGLLAAVRESEIDFEEDRSIELRILLRQSLVKIALHQGAEAEQVLQALLQDNEDGKKLRLSESWLVTEVKQHMELPDELDAGTLKRGYKTLWAQSKGQPATTYEETKPTLHEVVEGYLNRLEMPYEWVDESILRFEYTGKQGSWIVLVRVEAEQQVCIVYSIYPQAVPEEHRTDVAVFLTQENYDLAVGNFEMDTEDGELRYRTSVDAENAQFTTELFARMLTTNVEIVDYYFHTLNDRME
ncbi:hypothetical protein D3C85_1100740 [compost metagenome]